MLIISFCESKKIKKIFNLYHTGFLMICVLLCHFLGFVVYAVIAKLKFSGCTHNFYYSGSKSICGEAGPIFALIILIWLIFITPMYFIVARKAKIKEQKGFYRIYQVNFTR